MSEIKSIRKEYKGKELLTAKFIRNTNGQLVLKIKVSKEIENFFKKLARDDIRTSRVYHNSTGSEKEFYYLTLEMDNKVREIENAIERITLREYGSSIILYDLGNCVANLSVLRTKDISEGIEIVINDYISKEQMLFWLRKLKECVAYIYKNYIKPIEISVEMKMKEIV